MAYEFQKSFQNSPTLEASSEAVDLRGEEVLLLEPHRQGLVAARSLGRAGCRVVFGRGAGEAFPVYSRHVAEVWRHPELDRPEEFLAALKAFLSTRPRRLIVLPTGEPTLKLIARAAPDLKPLADLAIPPPAAALRCLDKAETLALASLADVPLPATETFEGVDRWQEKAARVGYPCVLKSRSSARLIHGHKALTCRDPGQLRELLEGLTVEDHWALLIQAFVKGPRHNCHFAAYEGQVVAYFEQRVLRTDRADGSGYGVEGISVAPSPLMRAYTGRLVARLEYTGIGCAQFLVDPDQVPQLLEINPRLDATTALPYACGVDLPRLAVELAVRKREHLGPPPLAQESYPVGEYNYWLFGDLVSWFSALRQGLDGPVDPVQRGRQILRALARQPHHLNWDWRDPLPVLHLYATTFPPMMGRRLLTLGRNLARRGDDEADHLAPDTVTHEAPAARPRPVPAGARPQDRPEGRYPGALSDAVPDPNPPA